MLPRERSNPLGNGGPMNQTRGDIAMSDIIMQTQSEALGELFAALSKAQAEIRIAVKDSNNPFFKSKYADLQTVMGACKEALTKNNLAIIQHGERCECTSGVAMVTILGHKSGQWIRMTCPMAVSKTDTQGMGSAITYYRRFMLGCMVGVVSGEEDDDGNEAVKPEPKKPEYLSKEQLENLNNLIQKDAEPADLMTKILSWLNLSSLHQVEVEQYEKVLKKISARLDKQYKERDKAVEEAIEEDNKKVKMPF